VERLPDAQLTVLDGCGHCVEVEKPRELTTLITDFLAADREPGNGR
jgi:pimeloyl-ACP methyl ester carboxylesterase